MTDVRDTQTFTVLAAEGSSDLRNSQLYTLVAIQFPSQEMRNSQTYVQVTTRNDMLVRASQVYTMVVVKGRVADPRVRAWTYTLDGHDYYILRLGDIETLIFDVYSQQWSVWGNADTGKWRAGQGVNWEGAGLFYRSYGSNIVTGDVQSGAVYFLDPAYPYDDHFVTGEDDRAAFRCRASAEILVEGPQYTSCPVIRLAGGFGQAYEDTITDVELEYSDDQGLTYVSAGTIAITPGDYNPRIEWQSLGSMSDPGRLFRIIDYGAVSRLDSLQGI